jgi:hypothetical protein
MIEVAAILSALVRHWADFGIIVVLLMANAVVGLWEEFQAGNAIAAQKANLALEALTVFVRRTRGPFWSTRPAPALLVAVIGTQLIATLIAVYGVFMPPIGWGWSVAVWGYSLAWLLANDRIKLVGYRIFDLTTAPLLSKHTPKAEASSK